MAKQAKKYDELDARFCTILLVHTINARTLHGTPIVINMGGT